LPRDIGQPVHDGIGNALAPRRLAHEHAFDLGKAGIERNPAAAQGLTRAPCKKEVDAGLEDCVELEAMALVRLIMRRQFFFELQDQSADFFRRPSLFRSPGSSTLQRKTREARGLAGFAFYDFSVCIRGTG
jgi:hypothetical protein